MVENNPMMSSIRREACTVFMQSILTGICGGNMNQEQKCNLNKIIVAR
jgi:hypothetical protein